MNEYASMHSSIHTCILHSFRHTNMLHAYIHTNIHRSTPAYKHIYTCIHTTNIQTSISLKHICLHTINVNPWRFGSHDLAKGDEGSWGLPEILPSHILLYEMRNEIEIERLVYN